MSEIKKPEETETQRHLMEGMKKNETKWIEAETLFMSCPKCDQKWAVAGEIPKILRFAFEVNNKEKWGGSQLICYSCVEKNE